MATEMKTMTVGYTTYKVVDSDAIHCTAQSLTDEQKVQARANIGAAAAGSGGGGGAAADPAVFTLDAETGEVTCDKNYAEALAMYNDRQMNAVLLMPSEGEGLLFACLMTGFSTNALVYVFWSDGGVIVVYYTPDGAMLVE